MFKPPLASANNLPSNVRSFDWLLHGELFLRWWLSELAHFVPARWHGVFSRGEEPVLQVLYDPRDVADADHQREFCRQLNAGVDDGLLLLGAGTFYVRRLELPFLASASLTRAVQFEALRFNPLSRNLSVFDYSVVERDFSTRRLQIDLFVVRQRALDTALDFARSAGIILRGVCVDHGGSLVRLPRLLPRQRRLVDLSVKQHRLVRRVGLNAAVAFALAALLVIRLHAADVTLHARMQKLATIAQAGEPERRQLRELLLQMQAVRDEQKTASGIAVLADLTHLLPDTAWLTRLSTASTGVHIQGVAQRASALIATLSASHRLQQVHFSGPIIKDPRQGFEQFELDLTVDGKPGK